MKSVRAEPFVYALDRLVEASAPFDKLRVNGLQT
jgi:hypothetical protein